MIVTHRRGRLSAVDTKARAGYGVSVFRITVYDGSESETFIVTTVARFVELMSVVWSWNMRQNRQKCAYNDAFVYSSRAVNTNKALPLLQVTTLYSYRHVLTWRSPKLAKIRNRLRHVATGGWKSSRWFGEYVLLNYGRKACGAGKGRKEEQKKTTGRRKAGQN